jgi:hypothetical protein
MVLHRSDFIDDHFALLLDELVHVRPGIGDVDIVFHGYLRTGFTFDAVHMYILFY